MFAGPLACVDILGRSLTERTIDRFLEADVELVSVLVPGENLPGCSVSCASEKVKAHAVSNIWSAIGQELERFSQIGIEHSFVCSANLYFDADVLDLFYFHRESRRAATRGLDREGPLELWMVDCAKARQFDIENLLQQTDVIGTTYFVGGYVNQVVHPRDLRRLVSDSLRGRCAMRPVGREIKPGVWVGEGVEIHRRSRIVAPAYVGSASSVGENTLITRFSNIERDCYVDYGTAIEDSSILANTHVGIWLELSHVVAHGNMLMSLGRDVLLEISDPSVLRSNGSVRGDLIRGLSYRDEALSSVAEEKPPDLAAQKSWQLRANPIQG
jgi:NDP-sugar pyrophosphorylase family protein